MQARLQSTFDDDIFPYEKVEEFRADIELIAESLSFNRGKHAGLFAVRRLLRRISTFGFHLATLDVRQDAMVHRQVVGELLGEDDWLEWTPEERSARLVEAIESKESAPDRQSVMARKTLAVFQAISFCRRKYGKQAIGPFIVSMTQDADDMLSMLLLANWSELHTRKGNVPLDIAPLLETVDDLRRGPEIMRKLLANPLYRKHLKYRGNHQTVMIGYSDSNKDSGLGSARWALHQAQVELFKSISGDDVSTTMCGRKKKLNHESAGVALMKPSPGR